MKPSRSFASDNNAVVHPEVLEAIGRANQGHVVGYGDDPYTESAVDKFREEFRRRRGSVLRVQRNRGQRAEPAGADSVAIMPCCVRSCLTSIRTNVERRKDLPAAN